MEKFSNLGSLTSANFKNLFLATLISVSTNVSDVMADVFEPGSQLVSNIETSSGKQKIQSVLPLIRTAVSKLDSADALKLSNIINFIENNLDVININSVRMPKNHAAYVTSNLDQSDLSVTLNLDEKFDSTNLVDVSILVHELFHALELLENATAMSNDNWVKYYNAPSNMLEIRTELSAWDFQIDLMNAMTDNFLKKAVDAMLTAQTEEQVVSIQSEFVQKFKSQFALNSNEKVLMRLIELQFVKTIHNTCKEGDFSNNFAMVLAGWYMSNGQNFYELAVPETAPIEYRQNEETCIAALPNTMSGFKQAFIYSEVQPGIFFKSYGRMVSFGR